MVLKDHGDGTFYLNVQYYRLTNPERVRPSPKALSILQRP